MNFTTYQILAFIGALAGIAIVFGIGFYEGLGKGKGQGFHNGYQRGLVAHRDELERAKRACEEAKHAHTITRLNAAQALEAITEELDTCKAKLTSAKARALTEEDAADLAIMAAKLSLAGDLFAGLNAGDQAQTCRRLAKAAREQHDRYWQSIPVVGGVA